MSRSESTARRLAKLPTALSSDDPLTAVRESIEEGNREQQVVVWAFVCILETNSAGLSILFDRFDDSENERTNRS